MFKLTMRFRVEWGETDTAGIIFYPNYYRWFDRAAHQLLVEAGLPSGELTGQGYVQPILECGARFHKPLIYHDMVELNAEITEVKNKTFRIEYRIKRGEVVSRINYTIRLNVTGKPVIARGKSKDDSSLNVFWSTSIIR
jgi:acyl-CoA thioester hydrolase